MTKKSKIKLSFVDDYTKIVTLKNLLNNSFDGVEISSTSSLLLKRLKTETEKIKTIYENLLSHLKLKNNSFLLLTQQLNLNNKQFELLKASNFSTLETTLLLAYKKLNAISLSLPNKLSYLKLNLNMLNQTS